jgi:hypothetical protein
MSGVYMLVWFLMQFRYSLSLSGFWTLSLSLLATRVEKIRVYAVAKIRVERYEESDARRRVLQRWVLSI